MTTIANNNVMTKPPSSSATMLHYLLLFLSAGAWGGALAHVTPYVQGKAFNRIVTIWLEDQDFDKASQNADINSLASQGILLTNYHGLTHPSQPNYIASIAGDYFGLNHDGYVEVGAKVSTVVDLLEEKEDGGPISWRGYFEGLPGPGYMGVGGTGDDGSESFYYMRKQNPFATFNSITHVGERMSKLQSLDSFRRDLENQELPQYAHISPNIMNNGQNTTLGFAATWSMEFLGPLLTNEYFMNDTLVLLTYDESKTHDNSNHVVSILLGGAVPDAEKGTTDDTFHTHYSILSTIENNWSLANLGRLDVGANVFKFVADKTGYRNVQPPKDEMQNVHLSMSYGGALNNDRLMVRPIPPPNQQLIGAGGKAVTQKVKDAWIAEANAPTPYDGLGMVWKPLEYAAQSPAPTDLM